MNFPWITSRPEIKVLDCTIRDGGLVNDHLFGDQFVRAVYHSCVEAGVDYMEIGYKNSATVFSPTQYGAWKFCKEDDLRRIVDERPSEIKICCMMDAGKSNLKELLPKEKSVIDVIRVAFYDYQIDEALSMIADAYQKGYEVSANLMAITTVEELKIDQSLEILCQSAASTVVVVDSYGSLMPEQTEYLTQKFMKFAAPMKKAVGIHAHNNQQLAFANSIEAIRNGATRIDASIGGLGRGAGNCPMELMLGYLQNPKFQLRPIYQCLETQFSQLKCLMDWGPYPEYMMTGQHNLHPRAAILAREGENRDRYIAFFDELSKNGVSVSR